MVRKNKEIQRKEVTLQQIRLFAYRFHLGGINNIKGGNYAKNSFQG